ncbi:TonB-dependent receptor [Acetobacter senegalensis]|uniref:TonB-dependent receptor n=1 Tax=Acetobacter senegalensis TaxID=446692 RepID=UPI00128B5129|nr:TonB-dependent receptor [Acetobacter senegalensis]MPQ73151.1 TonB-dependent receptor plug domain-containing protein [Acetobacter senegalensis]
MNITQKMQVTISLMFSGHRQKKRRVGLSMLLMSSSIYLLSTVSYAAPAVKNPSNLKRKKIENKINSVKGKEEEIDVRSISRVQILQKTPKSVSSYSARQLMELGVQNTKDLIGITPGLSLATSSLSPTGESQQIVIRGVGNNAQLEPGTGTYVDGIYMPAISFDMGFLDPKNVEIIKGPENTGFSRNSEAGVVSITTQDPDEHFHAKLGGGYSSYNTAKTQAYISGQIMPHIYASVLAYYGRSDGYFDNTGVSKKLVNSYVNNPNILRDYGSHIHLNKYTGVQQSGGFRSVIRFKPTDRLDIKIIGDYHRDNGEQGGGGPLDQCHCYKINGDLAYQSDSADYGVGINAKYRTNYGTVTSITSWREAYSDVPIDFVGNKKYKDNLQVLYEEQQSKIQTVRFDSITVHRVHFGVGVSGYKDREYSNRFYSLSDLTDGTGLATPYNGMVNSQIVALRRTGVAGFGHVGYEVIPHLHLDAGLRYTWEHVDASGLEHFVVPKNSANPVAFTGERFGWPDGSTPATSAKGWQEASPSFSARYDFRNLGSVYFSFAQGFKSGSYQKAPVYPSDVTSIAPETVTNYEMGGKFNFGKKVRLDFAGYDIEMKNQQVQSTVIRGGIISHSITNAAASRITGFETALTVTPFKNFVVTGSASYNASKFLSYVIYPGGGLAPVVRTGSSLPSTPDWQASINGAYTIPLSDVQKLTFSSDFRWVDSSYTGSNSTSSDPILHIPSWNRLDFRITYEDPKWRASFYVNNALNKYIIYSKFNSFFVQPSGSFVHDIVGAPMMTGFELAKSF